MTKKKITAEIVAHWSEEELFTALQKNTESKSSDWRYLCLERAVIESELARRTLKDEEPETNHPALIHRTYRDWGLLHPQKDSYLTKEQEDELLNVAFTLNLAFYNLVTNFPDHNTLPEGTINAILQKYAEYGAADNEGNDCAIYLLCEYYGAPQAYRQWRYPE